MGTRAPTPTTSTAQITRNINQDKQVKDTEGEALYLSKNLLCLVDQPFTIKHLATTLLHISQIKGVPLPAIEAIRTVAFLLECEVSTKIAEAVTSQICNNLTKEVASQVITAITPHVAKLLTANEALTTKINFLDLIHASASETLNRETMTTTVEKVVTTADTLTTGITSVKEVVDQLTPSLAATQDSIKLFLLATFDPNSPVSQPAQKSYSNTICSATTPQNTLPAPATATIARAAIHDHQILKDPHRGHNLHTPDQSITEIAEKLKAICDEIKDEGGPSLAIKAIIRLKMAASSPNLNPENRPSGSARMLTKPNS